MPAIKYYDTAKHQRWRAAVLRNAKYFCQECARYGRCTPQGLPVPVTIAHHIQPVEEHPELRLDVNNGEALCAACHNARHPEKGGIKGDPPLMAQGFERLCRPGGIGSSLQGEKKEKGVRHQS